METSIAVHDHWDDDFIDMDVTSDSNFFCQQSPAYPLHLWEFEFQMSSSSLDKESTTPADELIYEGKLLPLHFPPCFNMVEMFLQHPDPVYEGRGVGNEENFSTPEATTTATTPTSSNTPFESSNVSPYESCQASGKLNIEEHVQEPMKDSPELIRENPKKSWTKKIKLIKQSSFGSKLMASGAYLKSFFSKSGSSDDSCHHDGKNKQNSDCCEKKKKKKAPFGQIQTYGNQSAIPGERVRENEKTADVGTDSKRKSFSLSVKWHLSNKVSSSSTSLKHHSSPLAKRPNEFNGIRFLKRIGSVKSEMENPIEGAIAYCKRSQQHVRLRATEG